MTWLVASFSRFLPAVCGVRPSGEGRLRLASMYGEGVSGTDRGWKAMKEIHV